MKLILLSFILILSVAAYAQKMPDMGLNKIHITANDVTIVAEIDEISTIPEAKRDLYYFWYSANSIHATQGGFSGTLLNGPYTEYYLNKNLREQGLFKKGLKDGIWKSWNEDGTLIEAITWKRGKVIKKMSNKFWKRLHFFKKKSKADSVTKLLPQH